MKLSRTHIELIIIGVLLLILVVHSLNIPIETPVKFTNDVETSDETAQAVNNTETSQTPIADTEKADSATENINTDVYNGHGVSFEYPESWSVSTEKEGNDDLIFVSKSDPNTHFQVQITYNSGISEAELKEETDSTVFLGATKISNKTININGQKAYLDEFRSYLWPFTWNHQIETIAFNKNNNTYYLLLEAPKEDFNQEPFDMIINSFKVQ